MPGNILTFILALIALILGGSVCGIIALVKLRTLRARLKALEEELASLRLHDAALKTESPYPSSDEEERIAVEPPPYIEKSSPPEPASEPELIEKRPLEAPFPREKDTTSLELKLGTTWLNWIGIVMLVVGVAFFLKYAYDNAWIGPQGRLTIGVLFGVAALGIGERFRRKAWSVLFQVLTGGGLATFYLCIYFAFQVYHFYGQTAAMAMASATTLLATALAVAHNAMSIAVLAAIGGFLSPVLLSTGTNHPYALFTYIAILDFTAMGAAYFRQWRALSLLCFIGTALIYIGWYETFYAVDQMAPALIYISLFYLMFLLIPTLNGIVRRKPELKESVPMILANAVFSFLCYYRILFQDFRYLLGFVVLGQAVLVLLLFYIWIGRVGKKDVTSLILLAVALGLVTIAVPIQLQLYGIPVAWAMEGVVLTWIGGRFQHSLCRISGAGSLILAAFGLLYRLPLHKASFVPVINVPFGSWALVIAMAAFSAYLLSRIKAANDRITPALAVIAFVLSFSLMCGLLTLETSLFWTVNHPIFQYQTYRFSSLCVLWSLIPLVSTVALFRKDAHTRWMVLPWICFAVGALMLLSGFDHYRLSSSWLMVNAAFLPRLTFIISLWWCAKQFHMRALNLAGNIMDVTGHGLLVLLTAGEFERWGRYADFISVKMGRSLISAGWALQAFIVIWIGLKLRNRWLRYAGIALFGLAVAKILIIDMSEVEKVYRIVSFIGSGMLLVGAGYFYQRYRSVLTEKENREVFD